MEKLLEDIKNIEFSPNSVFDYNLNIEFNLIASHIESDKKKLLKNDFDQFLNKGKFLVFNTFVGSILFLKVSEPIENIKIESRTGTKDFQASVVYTSNLRRSENIKYKPQAGSIESVIWNNTLIFPNFTNYPKLIQKALLIVIGKIVKRICEYGRINLAYMKIENEFEIKLMIDGETTSKLKVELH